MKVFLCVLSICPSVHVTVKEYFTLSYRALPKDDASESRHEIHDYDGDLHLCHVNPVKKEQEREGLLWVNGFRSRTISVLLNVWLTGQSGASRTRRSASVRRRTWTSRWNRRRTSSSGIFQSHMKCMFPRQQRLQEEQHKENRYWMTEPLPDLLIRFSWFLIDRKARGEK